MLLHDRGLTIRGVQRMIREEGTAAVAALSPPLDTMASTEDLFEGSAEEAAWRADETQEDLPKADAAATQQAAPRRAAADDRQTHLALDTPETDQPVPDTAPEPDRPAPDTAPAPAASPPTDAMATPAPASSTCADGLARLATLVGGTTEGRLRPDTITALRALLARMGTDPA
ncbi:transcriptional regulator, MerR family [Roseibacterium elongatum DSM 19469]|uniref:Transcriptional regulator, MerR family n=1 Tax=Roseicyclus elongatus DSM 19469 TaxID=1294273 RepID=W8RUF9_9RHOB|nr:transcriptional regulator, MerR family [Roseibacterium elongatum DSM 19469]